ncbi:hypothetical protein OCK02_23770 [Rhizobium sp. TRM96647]|uniref:hypothetical protein n=1 Tax=unclassified Rhizobium TaxID=2613769 RepID=UPI0021E7AE8D|nr:MULTISPECIES: hypothetical protein [unclassified Rhizobium]MCV3739197.1 hypothetical protein [Rhizobium sp. TRM96647]MCV3760925.1 hypothetical protein [Rhizobium sp. TRM96650]
MATANLLHHSLGHHRVIGLECQCMLGLLATAGVEAGPFWRGQIVVSNAGGL